MDLGEYTHLPRLAKELGICTATVRRHLKGYKVPYIDIGHKTFVHRAEYLKRVVKIHNHDGNS